MNSELKNVGTGVRISLVGKGSSAFMSMLDGSGINYEHQRPAPATITAGGEIIDIATASITALGVVLAAWVSSRKSRNASVTNNLSITQITIEMKPEEIANLLSASSRVIVFDTEPNDKKPAQQ
jgi:hypothetical protein